MPEKIGKYESLERIGGGGMGVIFRARDTVLGRLVALKFISSGAAVTDELRTRFFREAQACARLSHPNIVTVHDLGENDGRFFIVMELLEGEDLRHLIAQRRDLALEDKLSIMAQVCDGLSYAHHQGIVHRDIKPANIFLLRTGRVKILDFGVAQIATADSGLTRTGLIMGTLRYIAPEQVQGRADHRSDIFSIGAVFYELLSLRPPFSGEDALQLLEQLRTQDPPPLAQVAPAVPPELAAIVERAMRKAPEERFADLDEMRDQLEQVQQTIAEEAQRVRGRVRRQRDDLRALQASLAERIGASPDAEAAPPFDERGRLATMQRLEADLAARIEGVQAKIERAAALAPALQRGAEALEAGQFARAVTELEAIVAEMPEHAQAQQALRRARSKAEEEQRRRRLADELVQEARAALDHGGFALCLELLNQAGESLPADARDVIAPLREQAEVGLAAQETVRRTRQQAEQALEQVTGARRSAQAWAASQYAAAPWNEAEARSAAAQGAFARQAYAEASRGFEEATALYRRSEEFVRNVARTRGVERGAPTEEARTLAGTEQAEHTVSREDTMPSVPVVQPPPGSELIEAPGDRSEPTMLGDTRTHITDATRLPEGGPSEARDIAVAALGDTAQATARLERRPADVSRRQALRWKIPGRRARILTAGGLATGFLALSYWLLQGGPPASPRGPGVMPAAQGTLAQAPPLPDRVVGPEPKEGRPEPAPAAVAGQEARTSAGSLSITSQVAGVEVWLHDQKIGETGPGRPLIAPDLVPGTYRLRATKSGHRDWALTVTVAASERRQVEIDIQPATAKETAEVRTQPGSLSITSQVPGVQVWLRDQKIGETRPGRPLIASDLPPGTYRLRGSKTGHRDWALSLVVAANERREVQIDIQPLAPPKTLKGDDSAEMVLVPAGEFWMGSTPAEVESLKDECRRRGTDEARCKDLFEPELPRHRVVLSAFYIDRFEVTNALFGRFVRATGHRTTAEAMGWGSVYQDKDGKWQFVRVNGAEWRRPTGPASSSEDRHPVLQVSWHDADAYCRWAGKRLPTEAEWEKAARGTDGRRYPWGESWDDSRANGNMTVRATKPVGSYPGGVSPYGAHDMVGNATEWVADWYDATYYARSPERDPRGPDSGSRRVHRGGPWSQLPNLLRAAWRRDPVESGNRSSTLGFRCAKGGL